MSRKNRKVVHSKSVKLRQTPVKWPDFVARLKRLYGSRVLSDSGKMMDELREDH